MIKNLFVNLPVKNLEDTIDFFTKLGFTFDQKFTDKNATCMILNENTFVMFLMENFFSTFTVKQISDSNSNCEVINCIQVESREKVDEMVNNALSAGGKEPRPATDHGWMYYRGFQDINGHLWEVSFMDESKIDDLK